MPRGQRLGEVLAAVDNAVACRRRIADADGSGICTPGEYNAVHSVAARPADDALLAFAKVTVSAAVYRQPVFDCFRPHRVSAVLQNDTHCSGTLIRLLDASCWQLPWRHGQNCRSCLRSLLSERAITVFVDLGRFRRLDVAHSMTLAYR